jgi:hypothetical protein
MDRYPNQETKDVITGAVDEILGFKPPWSRAGADEPEYMRQHNEDKIDLFRQKLMVMAFRQMLAELNDHFDDGEVVKIECLVMAMIDRQREKRNSTTRKAP